MVDGLGVCLSQADVDLASGNGAVGIAPRGLNVAKRDKR